MVTGVAPGGPAVDAGLQPGDLITAIDGEPATSVQQLTRLELTRAPGEVVTIAAPLASALATAHGLGLVHGDVSPANVLFTADGMPLLADLGVARVAGERLATVDGTLDMSSPEGGPTVLVARIPLVGA